MLAYSPMFIPLSGAEWCGVITFDDPSLYYDHLQQELDAQNQHLPFNDYDGVLGSSIGDLPVISPLTSPLFSPPPLLDSLVASHWDTLPASSDGVVAAKEEVVDGQKKKDDHNASERIRRMKINELYSSLRSLLPATDQTKKLSIPVTVGRATKYITQLQNEVQELIEKKENLLPTFPTSVFSEQATSCNKASSSLSSSSSSSSMMAISVEAILLGNGEISIQISALKSNAIVIPISEVLRELEEEGGVIVVDVSSSDSSAGRIFHRIHLMVAGAYERPTCEVLREKVLSLCQRWESLYRIWIS